MKNTTIHRFKWFWLWQDDAEEVWLRKCSQQGWHLREARPFGYYTFQAGQPADYVYRLDYQTPAKKEAQNYLQLFQDAGWEPVTELTSWYYFRKLNREGDEPQILTDNESRIAKYQRLLVTLILPAAMLTVFMNFMDFGSPSPIRVVLAAIYVTFFVVMALLIVGVLLKIRKLKKLGPKQP